jgi:FkbM family methyltransferase
LIERAYGDKSWIVNALCAVGAKIDENEINVSKNSVNSSILPMLSMHENSAPESRYIPTEKVSLIFLDSIVETYTSSADNFFVNIDTQCYEWFLLDSAQETLNRSVVVLLELSLLPLYAGKSLWSCFTDQLEKIGIKLYAIQPSFIDLKTGQILQVHGLFF